jgi:serine/threonine protein kinase
LEYLAPEQTGRTGRSVDQRADLYALGGTLFELATGEPPFGTGDPLRLTHDHLARVPVPPAQLNRSIPAMLSARVRSWVVTRSATTRHNFLQAVYLAMPLWTPRDFEN